MVPAFDVISRDLLSSVAEPEPHRAHLKKKNWDVVCMVGPIFYFSFFGLSINTINVKIITEEYRKKCFITPPYFTPGFLMKTIRGRGL